MRRNVSGRSRRRVRRLKLVLPVIAALAIIAPMAVSAGDKPEKTEKIQILGLNDFHGQLEFGPPAASSGFRIGPLASGQCIPPSCYPVGGAEYLSTHVDLLRAENPENTVFVSAGDLIGATPLLSAAFHDEPTIEAFNLMELDYNGVGNHEFDEGVDELLRMQEGGCHPVDGCGDGDDFEGAEFDFLAANVVYKDDGKGKHKEKTIFKPYKMRSFGHGIKVAFVGMTLEGTPLIVSPDGIASVDFLDEAQTVNDLVPELKKKGADVIVVLLHEGGSPSNTGGDPALINSCNNPSGALPPIVEAMSDEVDIVITGHTNWAVNCNIDGKIVTGAASQGRLITEIDFEVGHKSKQIIGPILVDNNLVTREVPADPDMTALIAKYNAVIGPIANEVIGNTTEAMDRAVLTLGRESTLGRLIADAQLASSIAQGAGGQIALMNPGGIRSNFDVGPITYGEAFSVQPFSNILTTKTFTGQQIKDILEQQFKTSAGGTRTLILPVSAGFSYTWDNSAAVNGKVSNMMLNGSPIGLATSYRVVANNFLAGGGDDFPGFRVGTAEQTGADDLVALETYLQANNPYVPVSTVRITRVN